MAALNDALVLVVLGPGALPTARRLRAQWPGAALHILAPRSDGVADDEIDVRYAHLGTHLRALYRAGQPLAVFCAAGIVIRALAPVLSAGGSVGAVGTVGDAENDSGRAGARPAKQLEPPVLAIAEDGSAVVPLLGGLGGVNALARRIGTILAAPAAITTSGELRFGACLLDPPPGYVLPDLERGKHFVSDLLAGATTRVEGSAPWLDALPLPRAADARLTIAVSSESRAARANELLIHPRVAVIALHAGDEDADSLLGTLQRLMHRHRIAPESLAALLADPTEMAKPALATLAECLRVPLRFASVATHVDAPAQRAPLRRLLSAALEPFETGADPFDTAPLLPTVLGAAPEFADAVDRDGKTAACHEAVPDASRRTEHDDGARAAMVLAVFPKPIDASRLGRPRGRLSVVGLGPGSRALLTPAARTALATADDVLGYATYVRMAGPFAPHQRLHPSDNREERQRAAHAFALAAEGRAVVLVSSGDPGVFAMAAAVLEVLDGASDPAWASVALEMVPGVSAAFATAALAGAPLGHDFCAISLSDNLKPWTVIERRLRHAAAADMVLAFYNPISRARPWQLGRALDIVRAYREPGTRVVLGRDVDRPGGAIRHLPLRELQPADVDTRTTVLIGASTTRSFTRADGGEWTYTPRSYP
ncbi:precorrin-3B C(17)-methyltransferase [Chitinasiproducens palmae]|uniref:Precorrin-3 methyltransferase n=1 Tax=Chitinasiproducens palmae TaxID=1770053 RepID=A0A1H2PRY8_9BURK|nr:precorrin-3B C(17)-methyltransferase [Chitinasiproducens palmae]SDV49703.1 precorrin-3 methyltransferase [Chitinasiproducens palmae]